MAPGMNTHTASALSETAAHMPAMTNTSPAALAATSLRASSITPDYDRTHERVNDVCRQIAEVALAATDGRTTYSWEGNGIRLAYAGDTVDDQGDFAFGPTVRQYLVDGVYKTTAPIPSQSGTGLLNLALDHVRDCDDAVVEAKRQIVFLLLDPSLDLVGYTMRVTSSWHGLMNESNKIRTALAIRLAEVIEQKVLENPGAGLNLRDLTEGVNIVGYMVNTLEGSIFNLMKRIHQNESKSLTTLDTPATDDEPVRRPHVRVLSKDILPASAEDQAIAGELDIRALARIEAMADEADAAAEARAAGGKVRPRRMQEKEALVARTFLQQTGLPAPTIPELAERKRLLADLAAEDAAYDALVAEAEAEAAKASEAAGEKVAAVIPVRELGVAYRSFDAWYNLLHGEFSEHDADVPDRWLTIWEQYSEDDTVALHAAIAGREMRLHTVVAGVMSVPEKMNNVAKLRVRTAMEKYSKDDTFAQLVAAAAGAYDLARQGLGVEAWEASAAAILAHGDFPKKTTIETLTRVFDDAIYSLA
jgi:hypothetical protein